MYLRPIQAPKGALMRTQQIIISFFLGTGSRVRMASKIKETYWRAFCWYSRAFFVSADARVVYSTALSTWASILREFGFFFVNTGMITFAPVHHLPLVLHQHCDVHEHLVQLLDGGLQLHKHFVPGQRINVTNDVIVLKSNRAQFWRCVPRELPFHKDSLQNKWTCGPC